MSEKKDHGALGKLSRSRSLFRSSRHLVPKAEAWMFAWPAASTVILASRQL
jgi:hypothetical protein